MKKLGLLAAGLLLAGCATLEMNNLDWIPIGPDFPPTKAKNVEIIGSKSDITRPYGNLGLLRIKNLQHKNSDPDRGCCQYARCMSAVRCVSSCCWRVRRNRSG